MKSKKFIIIFLSTKLSDIGQGLSRRVTTVDFRQGWRRGLFKLYDRSAKWRCSVTSIVENSNVVWKTLSSADDVVSAVGGG